MNEAHKYDAICVLGVSASKDTFKRRVALAVNYYVCGSTRKILFCGRHWGGGDFGNGLIESVEMSRMARDLGIPDRDILIEPNSYNTLGNVIYAVEQFAVPFGWRRIGFITHSEHIPKLQAIMSAVIGTRDILSDAIDSGDMFSIYTGARDSSHRAIESPEITTCIELQKHPYYRT